MTSFSRIAKLTTKKIGKITTLYIWIVEIKKLSSYLWFINGQDSSGYIQIVVKDKELISQLKKRKKGDLLKIWGVVKKKEGPEKRLEIELTKFRLINTSREWPFEIRDDANINEDTKYRYRYLDLRRPRSKKFLLIKDKLCHEIRNFLHKRGFVDIETPILAQSSPEGARCFVVPSNLPNRYYTLPQSPQIFKQLLMMSGFDKHYQIDKSFRNEDARSNRQIEFSQLDIELSFTSEREIKKLVEKLLQTVLKKVFGYQITTPFPTLTYRQVMKKYGTDKPDLRQNPQNDRELKFCWITDWPLFEYNQEVKKYESFRHPFTIPKKKYIEPLLNDKIKPEKVIGEAFDLICNGEELLSGSIRIYQRDLQEKVLQILGYKQEEREKNFGYFLRALEFAAPPHGGVGLGIDRLLAVILNINNLKELIAFPKNIDGTCSLTGTPNFAKEED
ncbi:Aspartyl-tRNA synthetase [endosymbiont DhMRE of Dentiscutata heterogama]|uniref:amino acid--tRNA ligase-related protein n=1 Tax=endosymbiont DhMRE of Dentiscutata heterogama TaxID=1609546 RepID=UPI000629D884|nr:amino acid--tRNA ligase-related protein [endosymbiont DhMRE of Dentiscutata heterogama]CFW92916.1 Aspartyl-tRNA synthetase [endosymbiont DhMRE of Dentiscutata heterogama]